MQQNSLEAYKTNMKYEELDRMKRMEPMKYPYELDIDRERQQKEQEQLMAG